MREEERSAFFPRADVDSLHIFYKRFTRTDDDDDDAATSPFLRASRSRLSRLLLNASFIWWNMANCSALHGTTLSAVTAFPRHKPTTPSSRSTFRHVPVKPRARGFIGFAAFAKPFFIAAPSALALGCRSCMMVRARSRGATAVRAATPASPPAKSCFAGCARGGVCSAERSGPVAAASQFHAALSLSCALGSNAAYFLNSAYPTVCSCVRSFDAVDAHLSFLRSSKEIMAFASSALAEAMPSARTAASVSDAAKRRVVALAFDDV
mmetsp:Transcript_11872/g.50879  ORF Transcript_11872/g.50879 Transcript_11872/m.50879 type:complete len:266 (+) Transcript_11872:1982-2779(+)